MKKLVVLLVMGFALVGTVLGEGILTVPKEKLAFPYDFAGFGAWIKLSEVPDFEVVGSHFEQILQVSDNHILGWTKKSGPEKVKVYIYADVNGYLVTFLDKDTPPSAIIDFSYVDFPKREVKTFTILAVMQTILEDLGYDFGALLHDIKFADFQHPDANAFLVALTSTPEFAGVLQNSGWKWKDVAEGYLHVAVSDKGKVYSYSFATKFRGVYWDGNTYTVVYLYMDKTWIYGVCSCSWHSDYFTVKNCTQEYPEYYGYLYYLQGRDEKYISKKFENGNEKSLTFKFDPLVPHTFSMKIKYQADTNYNAADAPIWGKVAVVVVYRK